MAEISKPDYRYVWASGGALVAPSSTKIGTGWVAEVPTYQWENYLQNRQDSFLVHINQHGIPQWDALTEYFAGRSYCLGSDGLIYKSVAASSPATTTQDPTTDVNDTYWTVAFATPGQFITQATGDTRYLQKSLNGSDIANTTTFRANISVYSKAETDALVAPVTTQGVKGAFSNLRARTAGTNLTISITADELCLKSVAGAYTTISGLNISINAANAVGLNSLDTGTLMGNTWYYAYVIYNPTTKISAGLLSASATSPTLPAGFTFSARVSAARSAGTSPFNFLSTSQFGRTTKYEVATGTNVLNYPSVAQGTINPAQSFTLTPYVPPTAVRASLVAGSANAGFVGFAPVGGFTTSPGNGYLSPTQQNGFPYAGGYNASSPVPTCNGDINLISMAVMYCASNTGSILQCMGWEDSI